MMTETIFAPDAMLDWMKENIVGYGRGPSYTCTKGTIFMGWTAWGRTDEGMRTYTEFIDPRAENVAEQSNEANRKVLAWASTRQEGDRQARVNFSFTLRVYEGQELSHEPSSGWDEAYRDYTYQRQPSAVFDQVTDEGEGVTYADLSADKAFSAWNLVNESVVNGGWMGADGVPLYGQDRWLAYSWRRHPLFSEDDPKTHTKSVSRKDQDGNIRPRFFAVVDAHFATRDELIAWMKENGVALHSDAAVSAEDVPEGYPDPDQYSEFTNFIMDNLRDARKKGKDMDAYAVQLASQWGESYPGFDFDWVAHITDLLEQSKTEPPF